MHDDDLPIQIVHHRAMIDVDGELEEESNTLLYRFAGFEDEVVVLVHFNEPHKAMIMWPNYPARLPIEVIDYLTQRFEVVLQSVPDSRPACIWDVV
jgi:hypothetical protein